MWRVLFRQRTGVQAATIVFVPTLALLGAYLLRWAGQSGVHTAMLTAGWAVVTAALLTLLDRTSRVPRVLRAPAAFGILVATAFTVALVATGLPVRTTFVTDQAELRVTRSRLAVVGRDLDRLQAHGARPSTTRISGCAEDSGDVWQPAAAREWHIGKIPGVNLAPAIVADMIASGWDGSAVADRFGNYRLSRRYGPWVAEAFIASPIEELPTFVSASVRDMKPCAIAD